MRSADTDHRISFALYSSEEALSSWHRANLFAMHALWESWNKEYFGGQLIPPHILLAEPSGTNTLGDYTNFSGWGSPAQIRLRPSLITGNHPLVKSGDQYQEGRNKYVLDVLLHETIHQYTDEVLHDLEASYKGHGPQFAAECNRLGEILGLPPVRPAKARGKNKDMPSCAQWPHCVRPDGFYLGALEDRKVKKTKPAPKPDPAPEPVKDDVIFLPRDPVLAAKKCAEVFEGDDAQTFADVWLEETGVMSPTVWIDAEGLACDVLDNYEADLIKELITFLQNPSLLEETLARTN